MTTILYTFESKYQKYFAELFRLKLGLQTSKDAEDMKLLKILLDLMERKYADFTQTFRDLSELSMEDLKSGKVPESAWGLKNVRKDSKEYARFMDAYAKRLEGDKTENDEERMRIMQKNNPRYILRNWMAQRAIEMAENDDFSEVEKVMRVLKKPYDIQMEAEEAGYARPPPSWSKLLKVSCSS